MPRGIPKKPKVEVENKVVNKAAGWAAKPDMGDIKPPVESGKDCQGCSHKKDKHYGSTRDWCNTQGCNCQGFK